jgi:hypothetical protein
LIEKLPNDAYGNATKKKLQMVKVILEKNTLSSEDYKKLASSTLMLSCGLSQEKITVLHKIFINSVFQLLISDNPIDGVNCLVGTELSLKPQELSDVKIGTKTLTPEMFGAIQCIAEQSVYNGNNNDAIADKISKYCAHGTDEPSVHSAIYPDGYSKDSNSEERFHFRVPVSHQMPQLVVAGPAGQEDE